MTSKFGQLETMSILVADTGDLDAIRTYRPVDCTTNPSLVLKASRMPSSASLVADAIQWSEKQSKGPADRARNAAIRLGVLVGQEATRIVPGRVSIEVDPRLSFDSAATEAQAHDLIDQFTNLGIDRSRILIKIAATWEGIQAARLLQLKGIDCNLTLIFSEVQAFAAADANAFLISPFVGRITDWHRGRLKASESMSEDPGVNFVRGVYQSFKMQGRGTIVMAASFRSVAQVEALAGCDRLTIAPDLLKQLMEMEGRIPRALAPPAGHSFVPVPVVREAAFRFALSQDAMANEKLSEGIRGFVADTEALEHAMAETIESGTPKPEPQTALTR
jgi:transaldolase